MADDEDRLLGALEQRPERARVSSRGVVEALAPGKRLIAPVGPLPRAVVLDRRSFELSDVDVVEQRLDQPGNVAAGEHRVRRLPRALEPGLDAELERECCELVPDLLGLRAAVSGDRHRNRRVAVDAALGVQARVRVPGQHVQRHSIEGTPPRPGPEGSCLNGQVQTEVEELPENRVRLTVQVPSHDVHHAIEHAATDLAASVKIPGFRKGKVPRQVLLQRVGKDRLMAEAIDSHITGWFWNAAARSRLRPVAQPEYDFELPADDDQDWKFTATVAVQAKPEVADWTQLEVGAVEAEVPEELVQQEIDAVRATVAELVPVEGRPVGPADTVIVDLVSPNGETRRDYVVELGREAVVEEIEAGVAGMSAGETKEIDFEVADGTKQAVTITVKEIKEKVLPEVDDALALAATEFETLAELREDIESRLRGQIDEEIEAQFRADVADALVSASKVDASGPLVEARARELLRGLARQVESRGVQLDTYLSMTGQNPDELLARLHEEATRSVARELVLEAAAEKLGIDVPDEEIEALVREQAEAHGEDAEQTLLQLRESGRIETLRDDLRMRNALDRVASEVKRIPRELAEARDALWTPEKEKQPTDAKLWTPGS